MEFILKDDGNDVDLRLARLEYHMERRPELVSSVMLRQNPHNVHEWLKRVKLFEGKPTKQILTFTEAVKTVDIAQAVGKPHALWVAFASFYEKHGDVPNARVIYEKAVQVSICPSVFVFIPASLLQIRSGVHRQSCNRRKHAAEDVGVELQVGYKLVDDLATVWCEWAELELRHNQFAAALSLMRRATKQPNMRGIKGADAPVQAWLHKNLKLWSFYCDLEESLGTLASSREVYDRMIELKIATPQIFLNYAHLLWEGKYFEDAFRVYEKGVAAFKYPHVKDLWQAYLTQFVGRYGGKKLERARDLYEQALGSAPPAETKTLFEQYAKLEEEHGLSRHAMTIYERACKTVPDAEKVGRFSSYVGPTCPVREHMNALEEAAFEQVPALLHSLLVCVLSLSPRAQGFLWFIVSAGGYV